MPILDIAALTHFWSQKTKLIMPLFGGSEYCLTFAQYKWTSYALVFFRVTGKMSTLCQLMLTKIPDKAKLGETPALSR